jgi:hypothetical protein
LKLKKLTTLKFASIISSEFLFCLPLHSFLLLALIRTIIDIEGAKIDCLSLFMCPLLAQLKIGFFSSFSDAAVYSTNEANKAALGSL